MRINNCSLWSLENRLMISRWMLKSREERVWRIWVGPIELLNQHDIDSDKRQTMKGLNMCERDAKRIYKFRLTCPVRKCLTSFHFLNWPRFHRNLSNKCVNSWLEIKYCTRLKHFYPSVHFCIIYSTNLTGSHQDLFTHLKSANISPTGLSCQNYPWDVLMIDLIIRRHLKLKLLLSATTTK